MIPLEVKRALDRTGLPWEIKRGSRHKKIVLAGILIGILPLKRSTSDVPGRSTLNTVAAIRRAARTIKENQP